MKTNKPNKGYIQEASFFKSPRSNGKFVVCVVGRCAIPVNDVLVPRTIRTSFVVKTFTEGNNKLIETNNSIYYVDMPDRDFKILNDFLKDENLDVERMKNG